MKIRFLGSGDSGGVPLYGCDCPACELALRDASFRRRHACVSIEYQGKAMVIDAGVDLRAAFAPGEIDSLLLTHFHVDHVQGLFDLRWGLGFELDVFTPPDQVGCADLYRNPGRLVFQPLVAFEPREIAGLKVTPLPLTHSKPTFGYFFEADGQSLAYLTDTLGLPGKTEAFLAAQNVDLVVLDASHPPQASKPRNHNDLNMALASLDAISAGRSLLTHIGHDLDAWFMSNGTPEGVEIARDGLEIALSEV